MAARARGLNRSGYFSPFAKNEERRNDDKCEAHSVVPFELFAEIENREHRKDRKRDDFLDGLQLRSVELVGADAVRRSSPAPESSIQRRQCPSSPGSLSIAPRSGISSARTRQRS
jgi:hypothetical protein